MPWNDKESRALRRRVNSAIDRRLVPNRAATKTQIRAAIDCGFPRGAADQMCAHIGTTYRAATIDELESILRAGIWSHRNGIDYREYFRISNGKYDNV